MRLTIKVNPRMVVFELTHMMNHFVIELMTDNLLIETISRQWSFGLRRGILFCIIQPTKWLGSRP